MARRLHKFQFTLEIIETFASPRKRYNKKRILHDSKKRRFILSKLLRGASGADIFLPNLVRLNP